MNFLKKDIAYCIGLILNTKSLLNFSLTCKRIYDYVWNNKYLWLKKIKSEFPDIKYENSDINFRDMYNILEKENINLKIELACLKGFLSLVTYFIQNAENYYEVSNSTQAEKHLFVATVNGHYDVVEYLISCRKFFTTDTRRSISHVILNRDAKNREKLISIFNKRKRTDYWGLQAAAQAGEKDLINFYLERVKNKPIKRVSCIELGLKGGCRGGQLDLIQYFLKEGAEKHTEAMIECLRFKQLESGQLLLKYGCVIHWDDIFCSQDNLEIYQIYLTLKAMNKKLSNIKF